VRLPRCAGALNHLRMLWCRLPESVRWGATLFVVVRMLFWLWGGLLMSLLPLPLLGPMYQPVVPAPPGIPGWALSPWNRWDVFWFTRIAVQGYGIADGRSAFAPLFPLLIGLLGRLLGGQYLIAAFLVSDVCCLGSLILLCEIAQRDVQRGRRAVAALLLYPFVFFLFVPYSESLLLLLTLAMFLAARAGRWWLVGLCGALAVLTKVTAITMLVPVAWELWERRQSDSLWNGLWLALLPLAQVGWVMVQSLVFGTRGWLDFSSPYGLLTPFLSPALQVEWSYVSLSWPWHSLVAAVLAPFRLWPHPYTITAVVDLLVMLLVLYYTVLTFRLPRWSYRLYTVTVFVVDLVLIVREIPLQNAPRWWMMAFPMFIAAAAYVPRKWERPLTYLSLLMQVLLSALYVTWVVVG